MLPIDVTLERWRDDQEWAQTDADEGFEVLHDGDRIRGVVKQPARWASAFEAGVLTVQIRDELPRVDWAEKENPWDRWESVLRAVDPLRRAGPC